MVEESQIGSLAWIEKNRKREEELAARKASRPPVIDEHVGLEQADREARLRDRSHPTSGSTQSIPVRWSSLGEGSRGKDPGK